MTSRTLITITALTLSLSLAACKKAQVEQDAPPKETSVVAETTPAEVTETTPAVEPPAEDTLSGGYSSTHAIEMYDGEENVEEEVTDCLRLEKEGDALSFAFELIQTNAHSCTMSGKAVADGENRWVYVENNEEEGFSCTLALVLDGENIWLEDTEGGCREYYCGARAMIDSQGFKLDTRDPEDMSCLDNAR